MDADPLTLDTPDTDTPPPGDWWPSLAGNLPLVVPPDTRDYRELTEDDLPDSDGVPMDNAWHGHCLDLLLDSLAQHWSQRDDYYAGGDNFVYFSDKQAFTSDFRGPDFFVVLGVSRTPLRKSWVSWQEGDRLPDVILELASPSTRHIDRGEKKELYAKRLAVPEYFIFDTDANRLDGWELVGGDYRPIPLTRPHGRMPSKRLGLEFGVWFGEYQRWAERWLRLFTPAGQLCLTFAEASQAVARAEAQRADAAESELARLRAELLALRGAPPTPPGTSP